MPANLPICPVSLYLHSYIIIILLFFFFFLWHSICFRGILIRSRKTKNHRTLLLAHNLRFKLNQANGFYLCFLRVLSVCAWALLSLTLQAKHSKAYIESWTEMNGIDKDSRRHECWKAPVISRSNCIRWTCGHWSATAFTPWFTHPNNLRECEWREFHSSHLVIWLLLLLHIIQNVCHHTHTAKASHKIQWISIRFLTQ